jgi:pyrroline-5-carboxylate reductase
MGAAIAERIKGKFRVFVFDKDRNKTGSLRGIEVAPAAADLVRNVEVVILAVKPQDFDALLQEIKSLVKTSLVISIAAGITTAYIEKILNLAKVVRVMPNLPAKIGEAVSCLCKGRSAQDDDLKFAEGLFRKVGETLIIDEGMMSAATAVSGSGPGFLCDLVAGDSLRQIEDFTRRHFIPVMASTASSLGFSPVQAKILAEKTGEGTVKFLKAEKLSPEELKERVASKGGTTEAGLKVLLGDIKNLEAAVSAARKRAEELSKKE